MAGELDSEGYAVGVDYVCSTCGRLHHGPHADRDIVLADPGAVGHIDWPSGEATPATDERPMNFSHGICPECAQRGLDAYHRQRGMRRGRP